MSTSTEIEAAPVRSRPEPNEPNGRQRPSPEGSSEGEEMPLGSYMTFMGIFTAAFAGALVAAKRQGKPLPERVNASDLIVLGVATHKLSRMITSDRITRPLRAPFTEPVESVGAGEVHEEAKGTGLQRAVGELVTCPFCLGAWIAAGLTYGMVFAPEATRLASGILTVKAISDTLNLGYTAAKQCTERLVDEGKS